MKWEYKLVEGLRSQGNLNAFGSDGWELAGVIAPYAPQMPWYYYFKRPIEELAMSPIIPTPVSTPLPVGGRRGRDATIVED